VRATLQWAGWLIGIPLEILIIAALARGSYRRYPIIFAYSIVLFLTTVIEISAFQASRSGIRIAYSWAHYYWVDEGLRQALMFAVVISLIYMASESVRTRRPIRVCLICGAVIFAGASFLIHYDSRVAIGQWMTLWTRDIDFSTAILDFALWSMLVASRHKNTQLLLLSGGLGIQFAGDAIGHSLRSLIPSALSPGDVMMLFTSLAGMWIWWQALRPVPVPRAAAN